VDLPAGVSLICPRQPAFGWPWRDCLRSCRFVQVRGLPPALWGGRPSPLPAARSMAPSARHCPRLQLWLLVVPMAVLLMLCPDRSKRFKSAPWRRVHWSRANEPIPSLLCGAKEEVSTRQLEGPPPAHHRPPPADMTKIDMVDVRGALVPVASVTRPACVDEQSPK